MAPGLTWFAAQVYKRRPPLAPRPFAARRSPMPAIQTPLVVTRTDPRRRRRMVLLLLTLWILSLLAVFEAARRYAVPNYHALQGQSDSSRRELAELREQTQRLSQRVAVLRRAEQVARTANAALQTTLAERDEALAGLRSDLAFYQRLTGGEGRRQGLAVHSVALRPISGGTAFAFQLTLTQNLNTARLLKGTARLRVDGVLDNRLVSLGWGDLRQNPQAPALDYEFRYFQQIGGDLILPENFVPNRIRVRVKPASGAEIVEEIAWQEALARGESNDVWERAQQEREADDQRGNPDRT
jgi:hypothetical protein